MKVEGNIVVWFSCGAASAVAAKLAVDKYGTSVRVVNTPIAEEHPDNSRFLKDVQGWIGVEIESCVNHHYPESSCVDVWRDRKYMSGVNGAPCTMLLKKRARQYFEEKNKVDWHVLGFTADEKRRHEKFVLTERQNVLPVLIDAGVTKSDCFDILNSAGIKLPEMYYLGYPNANCIGCVKATSPTYWNLVRKTHPLVFSERALQSREIGCKLVKYKGKRIYLDDLPADAKGNKMKGLSFECGIFCEERD